MLSLRLMKFPKMNPDASWEQRRIPQCPHGRNPDHGGKVQTEHFWQPLNTCQTISYDYISMKFLDWNVLIFWICRCGTLQMPLRRGFWDVLPPPQEPSTTCRTCSGLKRACLLFSFIFVGDFAMRNPNRHVH